MAGITAQELKDELIGAYPPGVEEFVDWNDMPGDLVQSFGETLAGTAIDASERLRLDINPLTCGATKIADWESDLGLTTTRTALTGTLTQRRRAVVSRLREYGAPTLALIRSVVGPLLDYSDPTQLVILETDRGQLTTAHTYPGVGSGSYIYPTPTVTVQWFVRDDAKVSPTGCWVDVTLNAFDMSNLVIALTSPDPMYSTIIINPKWRGGASGLTARAYFPGMAGAAIYRHWQAQFSTNVGFGSGTILSANLFCEGIGRDITKCDGLGAAAFEWAIVYEASKSNGNPDLDAARAAIRRLTFATRYSGMCLRSTGNTLPAGDYSPIPDDANALPDEMIPG